MKYIEIRVFPRAEIIDVVFNSENSLKKVLPYVLSSIYYYDKEFAAECLLKIILERESSVDVLDSVSLVETYMQAHKTNFCFEKFLSSLKQAGKSDVELQDILELNEMFKDPQ